MIQKKVRTFFNEKNLKTKKCEHVFKGYLSTYNVEILNSFNPELQRKDTESAINHHFNHFSNFPCYYLSNVSLIALETM